MLDVNKTIVSKLKETGLPVYLENFLDSKSTIPCISYTEFNNYADAEGDTLGYSHIVYHIKVWGKSMGDLTTNSILVDKKMRELGFKRTNSNDLWLDGLGQRALKYENLALEYFN